MNYSAVKNNHNIGDLVQVVTDVTHTLGFIKKISEDENIIILGSFTDQDKFLIEKYGEPIYERITLGLSDIKQIITVPSKPNETEKINGKKTNSRY